MSINAAYGFHGRFKNRVGRCSSLFQLLAAGLKKRSCYFPSTPQNAYRFYVGACGARLSVPGNSQLTGAKAAGFARSIPSMTSSAVVRSSLSSRSVILRGLVSMMQSEPIGWPSGARRGAPGVKAQAICLKEEFPAKRRSRARSSTTTTSLSATRWPHTDSARDVCGSPRALREGLSGR